MLRREGFQRRSIVAIVLVDALVLGVAGTGLGLLLGDQLARGLFDAPPGYLATGFPIGAGRTVPASAIAIAAAGGIVVACAAVLLPALDLLRNRQPTPTRPARGPLRTATTTGAASVAAAITITSARPSWALAGLIALTGGLLLLLPALLTVAARAFAAAAEHTRSGSATFAAWSLRSAGTNPVTLALTATGAIAVFALVAIGGARGDLTRGLDGSARAVDDNADIWITMRGDTSAFAITPLNISRADLATVRRTPGVAKVGIYRGSWLDIGDRRTWVQAPPADAPSPAPPGQLLHGDHDQATAALRAGGAAILSQAVADELHADLNDKVTLPTPRPLRLRVVGISNNLGWPSGAIVINADDYARAWHDPTPSALQLHLSPHADPTAVATILRARLGDQLPAQIETRQQRIDRHHTATRQGLVRLTQISTLVIAAAILSMTAAMTGVIWQRRPSLHRLQLDGLTPAQLWRALLLEATVLLSSGCLAGATAGLLGQQLLTRALETITGFPTHYSPAAATTATIVATVLTTALLAIALPGRLATHRPAAPAS
nr:ABC transporter permease [Conexibacter arvalis]